MPSPGPLVYPEHAMELPEFQEDRFHLRYEPPPLLKYSNSIFFFLSRLALTMPLYLWFIGKYMIRGELVSSRGGGTDAARARSMMSFMVKAIGSCGDDAI